MVDGSHDLWIRHISILELKPKQLQPSLHIVEHWMGDLTLSIITGLTVDILLSNAPTAMKALDVSRAFDTVHF
jgi:hypothetical protein